MKKIMFFIATTLMCSCTLYESEKDQLDNIVGKYWEEWKAVNRDTTCCVLDFDSIMPFEWDTLVYFDCAYPYEDKENVKEYVIPFALIIFLGQGFPIYSRNFFLSIGSLLKYTNVLIPYSAT